MVRERLSLRTARDATIRNPAKQQTSPSVGASSLSLVDQTAAPDLLGLALNIAKLSSKKTGENNDAFSLTTSAYAVYATMNHHDPLDPTYYAKGVDLRRLYVTVGREVPDATDTANPGPGTIIGIKTVLINHRDLSTAGNMAKVRETIKPVADAAAAGLNIESDLESLLGMTNAALNKTGAELQAEIASRIIGKENLVNETIDRNIGTFVVEHQALEKVREQIKDAMQWSLNFQTKNRDGTGTDEYSLESVFDLGLHPRINLTIDAGFNYKNAKSFGADQRGGRFAEQLGFRVTDDPASATPIIVNVASEAIWQTGATPSYKIQAGSAIPLLDGIEIPLSVTWANRTDLINESEVRGKFGFSFDVARLATRLTH